MIHPVDETDVGTTVPCGHLGCHQTTVVQPGVSIADARCDDHRPRCYDWGHQWSRTKGSDEPWKCLYCDKTRPVVALGS